MQEGGNESMGETNFVTGSSTTLQTQDAPHVQGVAVLGEAPESDDEDASSVNSVESIEGITSPTTEHSAVPGKTHSRRYGTGIKYSTLLHKKLRESNSSLRHSIVHLVKQPLDDAGKELQQASQQLAKSYSQMNDTLQILRSLTGDLLNLQARMDNFHLGNSLLPDIQTDTWNR